MIGLLYLIVGVLYLVVLVMVTRSAYRWAARKEMSKRNRWLAAAGGFLLVYLPVFWDHIPTLVMHKYYCEKEAGFWVYKTLEQWKAENPGGSEELVPNKGIKSRFVGSTDQYSLIEAVNGRVSRLTIRDYKMNAVLPLGREEQQLVDTKNEFVLARQVGFGSHDLRWGGLKFCMNISGCSTRQNDMEKFGDVVSAQQ